MSERDLARSANNTKPAKLPAINVPRGLDDQLRVVLEAMKERLEVREGSRGNPYERALTVRDLETFNNNSAAQVKPTPTASTFTGITEERVQELIGGALSVEVNSLRGAIATVERFQAARATETEGDASLTDKQSQAFAGKARYTRGQLSADLASGAGKILSGALAGTTVMELDPAGNYVLFKHRNANINGLGAGYTGVVRTAVGITAAGFIAGYNRLSDGVWQNSIVIDSASGDVTILGTLKAGSIIEVGATVGGTPIGTIKTNASTALADAATAQATANNALASAATKLSAGSNYVLTGAVSIQDTGGLRAGNVTWDAITGAVTGGSGVVLTENGLAGVKNGLTTFAVTTAGDAAFYGDIDTGGQARFAGKNTGGGFAMSVGGTGYSFEYSSFSNGSSNAAAGNVRVGSVGYADAAISFRNVGVFGKGSGVGKGIGVVGDGTDTGGYFTTSNGYASLVGYHALGGIGVECLGTFKFGAYTYAQPDGSTTQFMRRDGNWATPPIDGGNAAALGSVAASGWARVFATNNGSDANAGGFSVRLLGSTVTNPTNALVLTSGSGNTVTFTVSSTAPSDIRLKENIQNATLGLDFVNQLRPVSYNLIADKSKQTAFGFIAQEVEKLGVMGTSLVYDDPLARTGDIEGHMVIHYPSYVAVLTKAIQELSAQVAQLQAQLNPKAAG